jgi:hypothetical protein
MGVWELENLYTTIKLKKQHPPIYLFLSISNESFHSHTPILPYSHTCLDDNQ